ncbi:MAG: hypothetical protein KA955_04295 [Prevotella sp.]|nr:hypothetical protein [Prevotella sp.]
MKKILAIGRAERFSPNSVEKDAAILGSVVKLLAEKGYAVRTINETALKVDYHADIYLSMGRLPETVALLKSHEDNGAIVINSAYGVEKCARSLLDNTMKQGGIPVPRAISKYGYWVKRGDAAAQSKDDVVYAKDEKEKANAIEVMHKRGISSVVVSANVKGDLVKFYGVRGVDFFRYFYPTDDGQSKFGDERLNDAAMYYDFDISSMQSDAERLADMVDIDIYGGDCIVRSDGSYCFIDFNDWPSFSRCCDEAAYAIASRVFELKSITI